MHYSEVPAPSGLQQLIKLAWTLDVGGDPTATVRHVATPDGCVEIIRRLSGRSFWHREQPECFVAGLIRRPAELQLSGDGRFVGVRLWPWAWNRIAEIAAPLFVDDWRDVRDAAPQLRLPDSVEGILEELASALEPVPHDAMYDAILRSGTAGEIAERSGLSPRSLQRWFDREMGMPPRTYLRLLRFGETLAELPDAKGSLARHAAEHGFADQAHMSREFRRMAGASAKAARKEAVGPFLGREKPLNNGG